jgi:hypothetical protein
MSTVRLKVDNIGLFLLFHVILCFFPILFRVGTLFQGLLVAFLLISMIYSVVVRIRGDWCPEFPVTAFFVVVNAVAALVLGYFNIHQPAGVLFFWVFIMIAAMLVCRQTVAVDASLALLADTARQPVGTTLRYSNLVLAAFMLPVGLIGLLSAFLPLDMLGRFLVEGVLALLRGIARFIAWVMSLFGRAPAAESAPPSEQTAQSPDMSALGPPGETPAWLEILEQVFIVLALAVVAALLIFGAARGLRTLYTHLNRKKQWDGEQREYIGPEIRFESIWGKISRARRRLPAFGESEEERVRRRYYKKIRRHIRRGIEVRPADTAGDIERRLREKEDVGALTGLYNRARYRVKTGRKDK